MKKIKLTLREKKMVLGGGIAVVIIGVVYFAILPFLDHKRNLKQDIERKTGMLKQYIQLTQEKDVLVARKTELSQRMEKASARLLNETNPIAAAAKLGEIADSILLKNVEVQNRRQMTKEERVKEDYQKVSTQIDFQCQIDQLAPVLYEIRNYDKNFLSLEQLDINYQPYYEASKDPKMKPLRVNLTLSTLMRYVAPEKKDDKDPGRAKPAAPAAPKA